MFDLILQQQMIPCHKITDHRVIKLKRGEVQRNGTEYSPLTALDGRDTRTANLTAKEMRAAIPIQLEVLLS